MEYYCPRCKREYEDSGFKYCPLCVVKLKEKSSKNMELDDEISFDSEVSIDFENDEEIIQKQEEIDSQNQQINELKTKLDKVTNDDDIIEYKYQIMKKKEKLQVLNQELNDIIETKKKIEKQKILDNQRDKLFKTIYITISDEQLNDFLNNNEWYGYSKKEEIINAITDYQFSENFKKGNESYGNHDYKNALKYYNLALNECKSDIVWVLKGHCHALLDEYDEALIYLNRSLDINPNSNFANYLKLEICYIQKKYDEGIKYCNRLLKLNKNNFLIWHYKGKLLFGKQEFSEALKYLDKALDLKADDAMSWHIKSASHANLNQIDDAIKCNKKALKFNPDNEDFIKLSKILEKRRDS